VLAFAFDEPVIADDARRQVEHGDAFADLGLAVVRRRKELRARRAHDASPTINVPTRDRTTSVIKSQAITRRNPVIWYGLLPVWVHPRCPPTTCGAIGPRPHLGAA
jgi:hypothetical protein